MVKAKIKHQEEILRFRVRQYLKKQKWGNELGRTLNLLELEGCSAYVVGGFLRDLMIHGPSANPRDMDVVFDGASADKVEFLFWNHRKRKNRFGGMSLNFGGFPFDVWSLDDTWAFRNRKIDKKAFSTLPQTTFLNIDAIAFKLGNNSEDEIFSNGFFECLLTRTLEINLEENPFPETCVMRSLLMASKLKFAIGPRLANYISYHAKKTSLAKLLDIQERHYGFVDLDGEDLRIGLEAIRSQLRRAKHSSVFLPERQLKFEGASPERKIEGTFQKWISYISEMSYVHTKNLRMLRKPHNKMSRQLAPFANIAPKWVKKAT